MGLFSKQPKIVETKTFSCPGMEGFTFEYPVFEGWEVKEIKQPAGETTFCYIILNSPKPLQLDSSSRTPYSQIALSQRPAFINPDPNDHVRTDAYWSEGKNSHNIDYGTIVEAENGKRFNNGLWFAIGDRSVVRLELYGILENDNFPRDLFFQTVINSFRLTK